MFQDSKGRKRPLLWDYCTSHGKIAKISKNLQKFKCDSMFSKLPVKNKRSRRLFTERNSCKKRL